MSINVVKRVFFGGQDSYMIIIQNGFHFGFLMTAMFASAYFFFAACRWIMKQ